MPIEPLEYAGGVSVTLDEFATLYSQRQTKVRNCIYLEAPGLFVGAGLDYGLSPSWPELVAALLSACHVVLPPGTFTDPQKARLAKESNETEYRRVILEKFRDWNSLTQKAINKLPHLPFSTVVTTNYTGAIYDVLKHHGFSRKSLPNINEHDLTGDPKCIFHIHGYLEESSLEDFYIILAEDEFEEYYGPTGVVENFLTAYSQYLTT